MSKLYIAEFNNQGNAAAGQMLQLPQLPPLAGHKIAVIGA